MAKLEKDRFEEILAECLDHIQSGRKSMDECLSDYPELAKDLAPLLRLSMKLRDGQNVRASESFRQASYDRVMKSVSLRNTNAQKPIWPTREAITNSGLIKWLSGQSTKPSTGKPGIEKRYNRGRMSWSLAFMFVFALVFMLTSAVYASNNAYPGMMLYPVKIGMERVQLGLTGSPFKEQQYHLIFAGRRLDELNYSLRNNQIAEIEPLIESYEENIHEAIRLLEDPGLSEQERIILSDYMNNNLATDETILTFLQSILGEEHRAIVQPALEAARLARETARQVIQNLPEIRSIIQKNLLGTLAAATPTPSLETSLTPPLRETPTPTVTYFSDYTPFPEQTYAVTYQPPLWVTITPDWNWLATRFPSLYPTLSSLATQYPDLTLTPRPLLRPTRIRPTELPPIRQLPRQP